MLLLNLTGCYVSFGRKNSSTDKSNNINLEIIKNYSKAISREPNNFFFYLERGRAKNEYGDFKGAIKDFNHSYKIKFVPFNETRQQYFFERSRFVGVFSLYSIE